MKQYGSCQKCQSLWQELFLYDDRLLGKACGCYDEEVEHNSGKTERDTESLEEYRSLVAGAQQGTNPTTYTKLLLHFNGSQSNEFIDEVGHFVSTNGVRLDTSQKVFGVSSAYFNGSSYLSIPDSDDWYFGTGDFTIEFRTKFNTLPSSSQSFIFLEQYIDDNNRWRIRFQNYLGGQLQFRVYSSGSSVIEVAKSSTIAINTWYHIALVRSGNTFYFFQNGVSLGTSSDTSEVPNFATSLQIGRSSSASLPYYFNGWLDELRITKGLARWTSNFTVPTSAYTFD